MGQGGVGKTAMVLRFTAGAFSEAVRTPRACAAASRKAARCDASRRRATQYQPTVGDLYTKDVEVNGMPRHLEIDDTAGQEIYSDIRKDKMSTGDVRRLGRASPEPAYPRARA